MALNACSMEPSKTAQQKPQSHFESKTAENLMAEYRSTRDAYEKFEQDWNGLSKDETEELAVSLCSWQDSERGLSLWNEWSEKTDDPKFYVCKEKEHTEAKRCEADLLVADGKIGFVIDHFNKRIALIKAETDCAKNLLKDAEVPVDYSNIVARNGVKKPLKVLKIEAENDAKKLHKSEEEIQSLAVDAKVREFQASLCTTHASEEIIDCEFEAAKIKKTHLKKHKKELDACVIRSAKSRAKNPGEFGLMMKFFHGELEKDVDPSDSSIGLDFPGVHEAVGKLSEIDADCNNAFMQKNIPAQEEYLAKTNQCTEMKIECLETRKRKIVKGMVK